MTQISIKDRCANLFEWVGSTLELERNDREVLRVGIRKQEALGKNHKRLPI